MITARGLCKSYGDARGMVKAVRGVDLSIASGEMVAITGPSGSGKSTLLHILGCLVLPDSGEYHLEGSDVTQLSSDQQAMLRSRRIGFVFQATNLLPWVSVLENVEMPLLYAGQPHAKKAAIKALRSVGLADCLRRYPTELDAGQRQRVTIARAMVAKPAVILADEPTGNLDTQSGQALLALLVQLHDQGQTIVIATHDARVAEACGRQIRLGDGKVVEDGPC